MNEIFLLKSVRPAAVPLPIGKSCHKLKDKRQTLRVFTGAAGRMRNGDILRDGKEKRFRRNRFSFQRNCLSISSVLPFLICSGCAVPVGMVESLASCAAAVAKYPRKSIFQDITQVIVIKQTIEHDF